MKLETFHWLMQRVTAVFLLVIFVFLVVSFFSSAEQFSFFSIPERYPVTMCSVAMLFLVHGFLGMKVIMEDYISSTMNRRILEMSLYIFLVITFFVAFYMMLSVVSGHI